MNSLILRTVAEFLKPLLILFSLFLLFRGHHEPGGGFTGGLVAGAAYVLHALTRGTNATRALIVDPRLLVSIGLLTALSSGLFSVLSGLPFMTGIWAKLDLPVFGALEIGTPIVFDVGVYLVVVGTTLTMFLALADD